MIYGCQIPEQVKKNERIYGNTWPYLKNHPITGGVITDLFSENLTEWGLANWI
jgi:hypothetical protein